jgi:DNA-binding NtrC family response regulator
MIMVVEQHQCARASLSELLSDRGHRVIQAADAAEAIERIDETVSIEVILLDLEIAGSAHVIKHVRTMAPKVIVFGMSRRDAVRNEKESLDGFFCKPLEFQELYREICSAAMRAD